MRTQPLHVCLALKRALPHAVRSRPTTLAVSIQSCLLCVRSELL